MTIRNFKAQQTQEREQAALWMWALAVVILVLIVLSGTGALKGSQNIGTSCQSKVGYLCQNPTFGKNGNVSFTLVYTAGSALYNVGLACAATPPPAVQPNPRSSMVYVYANGIASDIAANGPSAGFLNLSVGGKVKISALKCYDFNAKPVRSLSNGTVFTEYLWINYTMSAGAPSSSNPMLTTNLAILTAKVE